MNQPIPYQTLLLSFNEASLNEKKFDSNQTKSNSSNYPLHQLKFDQFQVKKYWESLPPKEKELLFTLKPSKIIDHFLNITRSMPQIPNFKPILTPNIPKKPLFWLMEYDDFAYSYYSIEIIYLLLSRLLLINCQDLSELKNLPEDLSLHLTQNFILDTSLFEEEKSFLLKCKVQYLDYLLMIMEHYIPNFLSGNKILLYEEKYESFFLSFLNQNSNQPHPIIMEICLKLICVLFENNVLRAFYQWDFCQNLQKVNTFYFLNENNLQKPLKTRAIMKELKISLVIKEKTMKKKEKPLKIVRNTENNQDFEIINALGNPKNYDFIMDFKEDVEMTPKKKKLELKNKIKGPGLEFFINNYDKISKIGQISQLNDFFSLEGNGQIVGTPVSLIEQFALFNKK